MRPIVNYDENDLEILWFCLLCYDWSRNLAPPYQPITQSIVTWPSPFLNNCGATIALFVYFAPRFFSNSSADYCKFVSFLLA